MYGPIATRKFSNNDEEVGVAQAQLPATPRRRSRRTFDRRIWVFVIPAMVAFLFVVVWPSIQGAGYAFTDWDGISPDIHFVGISELKRVVTDPQSLRALVNTLVIAATITVLQTAIGLLLALGVNSRIKSRNVLRVLFFAPVVITPAATGFLWQNLLSPDGAINEVLRAVGLGSLAQPWLGSSTYAIWCICLVVIWQFSGYSMVIFLANLQGISPDVLEAAEMDGAGPVRKFWNVVRPELGPALTINLMLSIIGGLKLFDQVFIITGGGPGGDTETMSTLLVKTAFNYGEFSYGIAIALVLAIVVSVVSIIQYRLLSRTTRGQS